MIEYEIIIGLVKNGNFYTRSPEPEISTPSLLTEIKVIDPNIIFYAHTYFRINSQVDPFF